MSAPKRTLAFPPRLVVFLADENQPEQAILQKPGTEPVYYPSLEMALDVLRTEASV